MYGYIDDFDFAEMEAMKYFSPPANWEQNKKVSNVREKIFSGEWYGAEKKDGYFSCLIKDEDGNIILKTRSRGVDGTFANKAEWVPHLNEFFDSLPNGTCFLGELYLPTKPGSKNITSLLGCLKEKCIARQKDEKLKFYVFDCLAHDNESWIDEKAENRFSSLSNFSEMYRNEYVEWGEYISGEELWDTLQSVLAAGGEGMVITFKDAKYEPGKRSAKATLKVKQELKQTIDCVIIGANAPTRTYTGKQIETWIYWEDAKGKLLEPSERYSEFVKGAQIMPVTKNFYMNMAGSLKLGLINSEGKMEYFGDLAGLTDVVLQNWRDYIGKVVEVGGMQIDAESGHIRHPRCLGWRTDKKPEECTFDQISDLT